MTFVNGSSDAGMLKVGGFFSGGKARYLVRGAVA